MKKKALLAVGVLSIGLLVTACKSNTANTETAVDTQTTESQIVEIEEVQLSEIEQKIEDFKKRTSPELLVTQNVLRGKWVTGEPELFGINSTVSEEFRLGDVRITYNQQAKDSYLMFTNDRFLASYEVEDAHIVNKNENSLQGKLVVSGYYRMLKQSGMVANKRSLESEIELLITEVSWQSDVENAEIVAEFESVIGTTLKKDLIFSGDISIDLSGVTQEQLDEYDMEISEPRESKQTMKFDYRSDGSFGLVPLDEPIYSKSNPITRVWIGSSDDSQLFTPVFRTKVRNTIQFDGEAVEPGLFLYEVIP